MITIIMNIRIFVQNLPNSYVTKKIGEIITISVELFQSGSYPGN